MDIRNTIQFEIDVNSGSEKRVINRTIEELKCSENDVNECITWLLKKGFIQIVDLPNMKECERRYFESDSCQILRNVSWFDEAKYYEEETKKKQAGDLLTNIEKFKIYFSRMEEEFKFHNIYNEKNYTLDYGENDVTISILDDNRIIKIDFGETTNWDYDESNNSIFYKIGDHSKTIELFYMWGKCNLKHYNC